MLVFAEIIPKSVFRVHPNLTITLFPVIRFFYAILAPITLPTAWATRGLLKLCGGSNEYIPAFMSSREDVRDLVDESMDQGAIKRDEQEMIILLSISRPQPQGRSWFHESRSRHCPIPRPGANS